MKKIIYITVLIFTLVLSSFIYKGVAEDQSAEYKVLKVNGRIQFSKSKKDMRTGDDYATGMSVNFLLENSKASIIGGNVRFVLQKNSIGRVKILRAKSSRTPRGGALINIIDLRTHFDGRYLIFDREELRIDKEAFLMDETHFFYLRYKHGDEMIDKRLGYKDSLLIIDKDDLYMIDGKSIPVEEKEMELFYFDSNISTSYPISKFTPVFPDLKTLKTEVQVLVEATESLDRKNKKEEIISYLNEFYGKPQIDNLSIWLKKELDLSIQDEINFK